MHGRRPSNVDFLTIIIITTSTTATNTTTIGNRRALLCHLRRYVHHYVLGFNYEAAKSSAIMCMSEISMI